MIGTNNCRMIEAVMYGYTPFAITLKLDTAPPDSKLSTLRKPASSPLNNASSAWRSTPGTVTWAANW